jgi:hypothetical protein
MLFTLAVGNQPLVKKTDFCWPLALAALKNASANSSRTATIELLYTSERHYAIMSPSATGHHPRKLLKTFDTHGKYWNVLERLSYLNKTYLYNI